MRTSSGAREHHGTVATSAGYGDGARRPDSCAGGVEHDGFSPTFQVDEDYIVMAFWTD